MEFSNFFLVILPFSPEFNTFSIYIAYLFLFPLLDYSCVATLPSFCISYFPGLIMCALLFLFLYIFNPPIHQWFIYTALCSIIPACVLISEELEVKAFNENQWLCFWLWVASLNMTFLSSICLPAKFITSIFLNS